MINFVNTAAAIVSAGGAASTTMARWMQQVTDVLNREGGAVMGITATGSPYSYTAPASGTVVWSGATGVTLTRGGSTITLPNTGTVPVSTGDVVQFTYSSPPTINFLPR